MHFGENQLSRSLIGLSPLPTAHPLHFQLKWVRSSTTSYRRFNLAMGRSLRFGSRSRHCNALFRLAFATASPHGFRYCFTPLPVYFSPFPHGTGPLSVSREYLGLSGGPDRFARDFSGPVLLGILSQAVQTHYGYGTNTLSGRPFKTVHLCAHITPHQPGRTGKESPTTPTMQRPPAITHGTV